MVRKEETYLKLKENPKEVRLDELCHAAEVFSFRLRGGRGSH
ncbi:MAG: hypothetical protein ACUVQU_04795 [Candidatus Bipolaricaulia bacterium]